MSTSLQSSYIKYEDEIVVPDWIMEDLVRRDNSLKFYFRKIGSTYYSNENCGSLCRNIFTNMYRACDWYIKFNSLNVPIIDSIIIDIRNKDRDEILDIIEHNMEKYKFVRLCNASPKDVGSSLDCDDQCQIMQLLEESRRTNYMFTSDHVCLFMRREEELECEVRCFFHKKKLRAVSCVFHMDEGDMYIVKNKILKFFDKYTSSISGVYNSVSIDLCVDIDPFVVECNQFGCKSLAGAELFRWNEDFHIIHNSNIPVFRFLSISGKVIELS